MLFSLVNVILSCEAARLDLYFIRCRYFSTPIFKNETRGLENKFEMSRIYVCACTRVCLFVFFKSSSNRNLIRSHHLLARVTLRSLWDKSSKEDSSSEATMTLVWPPLSFRNLTPRISEEDCGDADGHVLPVDLLQLNNKCSHGMSSWCQTSLIYKCRAEGSRLASCY